MIQDRRDAAPLTQEDWCVWLHARKYIGELGWLEMIDAYEAADRRDAALMLLLTRLGARHYATCMTVCGAPPLLRMAIVHALMVMDPDWPAGGLDLT